MTLPRAREVHQSLFTTQISALKSLAHALIELSLRPALRGEPLADLLLLNGPGTCVVMVGAVYFSRVRSYSSTFRVSAGEPARN
jgi:beta-1,4-N-acetylglucosaminyltransferase